MQYQGLAWAGVFMRDLRGAVQYYRDVLGLRLLGASETWAHFDAGGGALVELFSGGSPASAPKQADQQSIIVGLQVVDLDEAVALLKSRGVRFIGEIGTFENTRWAHFYDLEGNRLEIKEISGS